MPCQLCLRPESNLHGRCQRCADVLTELYRLNRIYGIDAAHQFARQIGVEITATPWPSRPHGYQFSGPYAGWTQVTVRNRDDIQAAVRSMIPTDRLPAGSPRRKPTIR